MTYKLEVDIEAGKYLASLPRGLAQRIYLKMLDSKEYPEHFWIRLEGRKDYKLRIGDYRAIADIDRKNKTIEVRKIGHRRNIYDEKQ